MAIVGADPGSESGAGSACLPQCSGAYAQKGGYIGPPLRENAGVISWQAHSSDKGNTTVQSLKSRIVLSYLKRQMAKAPKKPTLEEQRAGLEQMGKIVKMPAGIDVEPVTIQDIRAEWLRAPGVDDERVILYVHGGAYTLGSLNTHRAFASRVSMTAGMRALLIEYRLAPEHPFPAGLEDCKTAYGMLLDNGVSSDKIAIVGDSAGGGLSLATVLSLRDAGAPLPSSIVCLSPWADLELTGESVTTRAQADPWLKYDSVSIHAERYIGANDPRNPLISPIHADFSGLPPILLQVGTREILLDDSTRLVAGAKEAGVDVTLEVWEGMWHVWQFLAGIVPESQQALDRIGGFVRRHMNLPLTMAR